MKAIVLAGGFGKRLGLKNLPKPMYLINGKPILEHNMLLLAKHKIKDICVALHYLPDLIQKHFGTGSKYGLNIKYSIEDAPLGTAGAVKKAEWFFDNEPFFVIYGDNYTDIDLSEMLDIHLTEKPHATIAVFDPKVTLHSGIAGGVLTLDQNNRLLSFIEGEENNIDGYVNAGVYIIEPEVLKIIPANRQSDFGKNIFPSLLKEGYIIKGYLTSSPVIAIDTNEALVKSKEVLGMEKYKNDNR